MSPTCSSHRLDEIVIAAMWQSCWQVALLAAATLYLSTKLTSSERSEGLSRMALLSMPLIIFANVGLASGHQLPHSMFLAKLTPYSEIFFWTLTFVTAGGFVAWGISIARVGRICRTALLLDASDRTRLRHVMPEMDGLSLRLVLTNDAKVRAPFVWGVRLPRVVIPATLWQRLDEYETRLLLLHELKHIQRRDAGWNVALTLVASLLWWLPMVQWLLRDNRLKRELVCDQSVLKHEPSPRRYAELLRCLATEERCRIASPPSIGSSDSVNRVAVALGRKPRRPPLHGWLGAAIATTILALPHVLPGLGFVDSRSYSETRSMRPGNLKTDLTDFSTSLQTGDSAPPLSQTTVPSVYCCSR